MPQYEQTKETVLSTTEIRMPNQRGRKPKAGTVAELQNRRIMYAADEANVKR